MATCPKVVKCAVAALGALTLIIGASWTFYRADTADRAAIQAAENARVIATAKALAVETVAKAAALAAVGDQKDAVQDKVVADITEKHDKQLVKVAEDIGAVKTQGAANGAVLEDVQAQVREIRSYLLGPRPPAVGMLNRANGGGS